MQPLQPALHSALPQEPGGPHSQCEGQGQGQGRGLETLEISETTTEEEEGEEEGGEAMQE